MARICRISSECWEFLSIYIFSTVYDGSLEEKMNIAVSTLKGRVIEILINASPSFGIRWKNIKLSEEIFYNILYNRSFINRFFYL